MALRIAVAAAALTLAGIGGASAQTFIVEDAYGPQAYAVAPARVYRPPVIVAPAPRVVVSPGPVYAAPRPYWGGVVVTAPSPWTPGVVYSDW
jgi:hypothetical protein